MIVAKLLLAMLVTGMSFCVTGAVAHVFLSLGVACAVGGVVWLAAGCCFYRRVLT